MGLHLPPLALKVTDLARLRGVEPDKYTLGLGLQDMALCPPDYTVVELATEAAKRALSRWQGKLSDIGLIAVGTESAIDMSRPLSAWVADKLGLKGAVRSYEVKHACYGGTLAVRQALEWKLANPQQAKAALVIATDIALYTENDPGEPTQGAGAVAMIIDEPLIAAIEPKSYAWSEPAFDFWRPLGEAYPRVDGAFSQACYQRAATECFKALIAEDESEKILAELSALCFHVPFPKMVKKAFSQVVQHFGWNEQKIAEFYKTRVEPTMSWNRYSGNAYTASLWIAVANTLRGLTVGEKIAAFSYGSGFGSELLLLKAGPMAHLGEWAKDIEQDMAQRIYIDEHEYLQLRKDIVSPH
jgi:hydroxymethylglutaryl-CoA synthase